MYTRRPGSNPINAPMMDAASTHTAMKVPEVLIRGLTVAVLIVSSMPLHAAVTIVGDVLPADNPFTVADEGLPLNGGAIDASGNTPISSQTEWEDNVDIIVGQKDKEGGRLDIDGLSFLRYQNLIIGDRGVVGGEMRLGIGTMLVTGVGALYNNDPLSLPAGLPPGFGSVADDARDPSIGFDMYVGRYGTGHLEVRAGGRVVIQDAIIIGDQPGSTGSVLVDGFASTLSSGGFEAGGALGQITQLVVGRQSDGSLMIANGGLVINDSVHSGSTQFDTIGAVIGSDPAADSNEEPQPGGRGVVTVAGPTSRWIISGSLQVGGFQERPTGGSGAVEGIELEYNSEAGRGTLLVQDGGLVSIRPAVGADSTNDELRLLIGRFGRVMMTGGNIRIGSSTIDGVQDTVQLLNDGVIEGGGRIDTGVFRNRYLGEVRVGTGQKLLIDSASEFLDPATDEEPLVNWGVIQVFGSADQPAELEFDRAPSTDLDPIRPFRNLRVPRPAGAPPGNFFGGLISGQSSILRFRSGIENEGMMAFTEGTNYITGDVINLGAPLPQDRGIINVFGPGVSAIFENDLINGGILNLQGGAAIGVLARHSFVNTGELIIDLTPDGITQLQIGGDAGISGDLTVELSGFGSGDLEIGDTFEIMSVAGELGGVSLADPLRPTPDLTVPPVFHSVSVSPSLTSFGLPPEAVMIPLFTSHSVLLAIRSTAGIVGADFNGDGFVDIADLAILQANFGIGVGATPLQGDADLDGDVDGDDFLLWQRQLGPVPAAGSGSSAGQSANVPEPGTLAMLLAGLLALATRRRSR